MCPTILLCLIILSLMSVWYKVQILDIDDSTCLIWNHARYSVPGYELENKNGLQCTRHNCNVRGCNASIYITWNDSVPQFRGKSDHDEWNNIKHSIHGHSDWGGAALIRESAITSINMDISIGKSKSDAFHSYSLSHPHESYALSLRDISHRLTNVSDKYPSAPASVDSIATDLVSKPQWKGNYYTHVEFELADKLQDDTLEQGFKDLLLNGTPAQLESSMNEWKCEMATLIKKISLSYLAVSRFNANGFRSDYFMAHNTSSTLFVFGEVGHLDILQSTELWLFDGTYDSTPSLHNYLLFTQEWYIHACEPSGVAGVQSESFPTVKILFATGDGNMSADSYKEAMNLLLDEARRRGKDLNRIGHRAIGDFEKAERIGIEESDLYLLDGVVEGCGYHFTARWRNALKQYNLWKAYLNDKAVHNYWHTFMCIRAVPEMKVTDAYHVMMGKAVTDVPRKYLNDIKRMATEYLEPIWINHEARFARCEWNEYRREIRANNHAESMNNAVQKFLGVHPEFYLWLWKSKQFSATQLARWRRYHENGFQRKRKVKEHLKNLNLKDLWDKVALPVNEGGISLYTYMRGVSLVYREKWSELNAMFGPLNYDNDKM
eukprot:221167_1